MQQLSEKSCWLSTHRFKGKQRVAQLWLLLVFLLATCATGVIARLVTLFGWKTTSMCEVTTANLRSTLKYSGFLCRKKFNTLIPVA